MADYLIQDTTLDAIADAINAKTGGSSAMTPAEMVTEIGNIPSGGGSANTKITIVSPTSNITQFLALLPSGHETEGFTATALTKPQSGFYIASVSGPVTAGVAQFAIMRSTDVSKSTPTATTGQAWGGFATQAGMEYEVIFYEL